MHPILTHLARSDVLTKQGRLHRTRLAALPDSKLFKIAEGIAARGTPFSRVGTSADTSCASLQLSGAPEVCEGRSCRRKRADELARYAALVGKQTISAHPLSWMHSSHEHEGVGDRDSVLDDFAVLDEVLPVLDAGLLHFVVPPSEVCLACQVGEHVGPAGEARLLQLVDRLSRESLASTSMVASINEFGDVEIECTDGGQLLEHTLVITYTEFPPELLRSKPCIQKLAAGERVPLSRKMIRSLDLNRSIAMPYARSAAFVAPLVVKTGGAFVTSSELEARLIGEVAPSPRMAARNRLSSAHISAVLPFAAALDVRDLVSLRAREQEAFDAFRSALLGAADSLRAARGKFDANDATDLYRDLIEPRLAELDLKVQAATRASRRELLMAAGQVAFGLTFGIAGAVLPTVLVQAAQGIGLAGGAKELIDALARPRDAEVRDDPYYFVWRARRLPVRRAAARRRG